MGAQTGVYVYAEAGWGSGSNHLDANSHQQTTLQSDSLTIKSKGDTTLVGAQATANRIDADVGGALNIISPQDTVDQNIEQTGMGGRIQISLGTAWEASGYYNGSEANGTLNAVNTQSGLYAGEGGYHINADSVALKGGAIVSTADKSKNELTANSLTFSNIENHSDFDASSVGLSGSIGGEHTGKGIGETFEGTQGISSGSLPTGLPQQKSGSENSTTYATLSDGQINIGGKQTSTKDLGINDDASKAHQQIADLPDLQAILDQQKTVASTTSTIVSTVKDISKDIADKANKEKKQLREEKEAEIKAKGEGEWIKYQGNPDQYMLDNYYTEDYAKAYETSKDWGIGGSMSRAMDAVTIAVTGALGGKTDLQVATNALAPYAAQIIGEQFGHGEDKNVAVQMVSHAILGAAVAYINGGNATAGGGAAVAAEVAAGQLAKMYDDGVKARDENGNFDPTLLSEEEKANIRDLSAAIGTVVGGLGGDSAVNAQIAGVIGKNAVENNILRNKKGVEKLPARYRQLDAKLTKAFKNAGIPTADEFQNLYDECKGNVLCQQGVLTNSNMASSKADQIVANLNLSSAELDLLTGYYKWMFNGAIQSGEVFNQEGLRATSTGMAQNQVLMSMFLKDKYNQLRKAGYSEDQIATRMSQDKVATDYMNSLSVDSQAALLGVATGFSVNAIINIITKGRGGKALSKSEITSVQKTIKEQNSTVKSGNNVIPNLTEKGTFKNLEPTLSVTLTTNVRSLVKDENGRYWLVSTSGTKITPSGSYAYVTMPDGSIRVTRNSNFESTHTGLANGRDVKYAGTIRFENNDSSKRGQIRSWDNSSGHYRPSANLAKQAGLPIDKFKR